MEPVPDSPQRPPLGPCPICGATVDSDNRFRPFCRERCKMVDLGRWFRGEYAVPGEDAVSIDPEAFEDAVRDLEQRRRAEAEETEGGDPERES